MDAKWLVGRADESVVAIGRCVKWAGPNMQRVLVLSFYWSGWLRTPILSLLPTLIRQWTVEKLTSKTN